MALQLLPSDFPNIRGKFNLIYQRNIHVFRKLLLQYITKSIIIYTLIIHKRKTITERISICNSQRYTECAMYMYMTGRIRYFKDR
jgi:hypothetical protein